MAAAALVPAARSGTSGDDIPHWVPVLQAAILAAAALRIRPKADEIGYRALVACYALAAGWYARVPLLIAGWWDPLVQVLAIVAVPSLAVLAWRVVTAEPGLRPAVSGVLGGLLVPLGVVLLDLAVGLRPPYTAPLVTLAYTVLPASALGVVVLQEITRHASRRPPHRI